jgi:trehalose 2-sulfotransferase
VTAAASILLCTTPRSGSWLLAEALEATGAAGHPREYFRPDYQSVYLESWGAPRIATYADYVAAARAAGSTANGTFCGKLHWGQLTHVVTQLRRSPGWSRLADAALVAEAFPNPVYLRLVRADKAHQAISLYRAIQSDVWWELDDAGPSQPAAVPAEPDFAEIARLEASLTDQDAQWAAYFARSGITPLVVTYAELANRYPETIERVLRALDLPIPASGIAPPRLRRQADHLTQRWAQQYLAARTPARAPRASCDPM